MTLSAVIREALSDYVVNAETSSRVEWKVTSDEGVTALQTLKWNKSPVSRSALRDIKNEVVS